MKTNALAVVTVTALTTITAPVAHSNPCPLPVDCGFLDSDDTFANGINNKGEIVGVYSATAVPAPTIGAGLPGLIFASGGPLVWWLRKRPAQALA
jgi:hypothetical protein